MNALTHAHTHTLSLTPTHKTVFTVIKTEHRDRVSLSHNSVALTFLVDNLANAIHIPLIGKLQFLWDSTEKIYIYSQK